MEKPRQKRRGRGIVKNEMLYMFLDEKLCFIRLPLDTLQ
jgi:hypothetical protein